MKRTKQDILNVLAHGPASLMDILREMGANLVATGLSELVKDGKVVREIQGDGYIYSLPEVKK